MTPPWLVDFLEAHHGELLAFRHHLHSHPELSHAEFATTELIAERLRVAGLDPRTLSSGTGLICDIGAADAPAIALRADIDALAMDDTKEVPYRSTIPGVAHACGHDLHTAVVLGVGLALASTAGSAGVRAGRNQRVRLIFEPAEEAVPAGAVTVIEDGGLDGVSAIFGFHADPKLDVGQVGIRQGPLTAAADLLEIRLTGPGGHTARPHLTVDLVSVAAMVVSELPRLVAEHARDLGDLRLAFGALRAGGAANVIPSTAVLRGSVRTPDREAWGVAESIVRSALEELVAPTGAGVTCSYQRGVPPVVNSVAASEMMADAARRALGDQAVVEPPRSLGGDSFALYQEHVPGCYARLGVYDPVKAGTRLDLHSGAFDVDDRVIDIGVRVMVQLVTQLGTGH